MANIKSIYGNPVVDDLLRQSVATEYSSSSTYAVGDMCLKDGVLYKCTTAISTAEAWTAAHWTAVTVGGELSSLKKEFHNSETLITGGDLNPSLEQGTIVINNSGWTYGNTNLVVRTKQGTTIRLFPTDKISLSDYTNYKFYVGWRLSDGTYRAISTWRTADFVVTTEADYVFVVRRIVDAELPVSTVESILSITRGTSAFGEINELKTSVNTLAEEVATFDARVDIVEDILSEIPTAHDVPASDIIIHDNEYMFTSGTVSGTTTAWQYGEYTIPTNAEKLIITANAGQSARLWILKDTNNTVIGYSSDSSAPSKKTETIDLTNYPTATKVFVNDKKSGNLAIAYQYNRKVVDGEDVYVDGKDLPSILGTGGSDKLYGKILCCAGDSITYGADMDAEGITNESNITVYNCNSSGDFTQTTSGFRKTWGWQIANRHNMIFYNGGVSGSTIQGQNGVNGFSLENGRYTKLPDNIDYLLIWFGWNDNAYGTLGQISDDTNASYYGGYNVVLPYLINKYPYAKIGLIVPFGASAGHREAVRLLGNKWGVAVWDNYYGGTPLYYDKESSVGVEASIVTANRAKFQANGAHPNFKGHRQLADMIEEWLKGI